MIEKSAGVRGMVGSRFLDLNHTSRFMVLVSRMIAKFARDLAARIGELRNRDTSAMIEKFAGVRGMVGGKFLDLNRTSRFMVLESLMIARFARDLAGRIGELRNRGTSG